MRIRVPDSAVPWVGTDLRGALGAAPAESQVSDTQGPGVSYLLQLPAQGTRKVEVGDLPGDALLPHPGTGLSG